jgi:hypothetical protein
VLGTHFKAKGLGLEQGQHPLAESLQQIPVMQRIFSNAFALLGHTPITPEWLNLYKLQLCCELLQLTTGSLQTWLLAMLCLPSQPQHQPCRSQLPEIRKSLKNHPQKVLQTQIFKQGLQGLIIR